MLWDGWRHARKLILCILSAALLAACGSGASSVAGARATTTTTVQSAVIAAWTAAQKAFLTAAKEPEGWRSPLLAETRVEPALTDVTKVLKSIESRGYVGGGTVRLGRPRILSLGSRTAVVQSCDLDGGWFWNPRTGALMPGNTKGAAPSLNTSTMVLTRSGWRLQSQVVNEKEGVCSYG